MRRIVLAGIVATVLLAGCSSTSSSGAPGTTKPPIDYRITEDDGRQATVLVLSADEAEVRRAAEHLRKASPGEDSRSVSFVCPGGPATVAYVRWANTNKGLVQTGLDERDVVVVDMTGQPCLPAP